MNFRSILLTFFSYLIIIHFQSCSSYNKEVVTKHFIENINLEGSWRLSKYKDDGGTKWKSYGQEIIYQKHLTSTHFTWFKYNKDTDLLEGAGGGTYKFEESTYTEYIEFFHPPGSTLIGQAIPFDVNVVDGVWFHTGYTRELEFDPESGELSIIDTTKIEEQWINIDVGAKKGDIIGTWDLVGYKMNSTDSTFSEYPDFVGYFKLITPSHFTWIKYNSGFRGGEVLGLGSGTWNVASDNYIEKIDVMYPSGSNQINTILTFDIDLHDQFWYHSGYIKRLNDKDKANPVITDSSMIDEIWKEVRIGEK